MKTEYVTGKSDPIQGTLRTASDKSISHRALIIGLINHQKTIIENLLFSDDVLHTLKNCRKLGAKIDIDKDRVALSGGTIKEPGDLLYFGNSGTGARLSIGLLAGMPFFSVITGDDSLRKRPMNRIIEPLKKMGAAIYSREGGLLPVSLKGDSLNCINYDNSIGSAQVKSAILLASISCTGDTVINDYRHSRDHTEKLLIQAGANIKLEDDLIRISASRIERLMEIKIPADISSAAFLIAYALLKPNSNLILKDVGINPTRTGVLKIMKLFGAKIDITNKRQFGLEPVADLHIDYQRPKMRGCRIPSELIVSSIDEIPIIAIVAASIQGVTEIREIKELRHKESDRIRLISENLSAIGINCTEYEDGLKITGSDHIKNAVITTYYDHRIAMSFIIAGSIFEKKLKVVDTESISTSYPAFFGDLPLR